jgi:predicted site-specific integrase-resolvase
MEFTEDQWRQIKDRIEDVRARERAVLRDVEQLAEAWQRLLSEVKLISEVQRSFQAQGKSFKLLMGMLKDGMTGRRLLTLYDRLGDERAQRIKEAQEAQNVSESQAASNVSDLNQQMERILARFLRS